MLAHFFGFEKHQTSFWQEVVAGISTFLTMSFIIAVNPGILSDAGIDFAVENEFSLIISIDCGIKAVGKIQRAKEANIDFIICDHHRPGKDLPPAVAILNPK